MPLDPQARDYLDKIANSRMPPMHELPVDEARALVVPLRIPKEEMGGIENRAIPGPAGTIPIRIYHPRVDNDGGSDATRPVLLYFHGGGWVLGSIASHDAMCRRLCNESGCIVVSVDYRLAPEHRYPAAVDDCLAATRWVAEHAEEIGADPARICVGGDSAGGNLAAVVAHIARDDASCNIAYQLLIYPITDYMPEFDSYQRNGRDYFLTIETMVWFWEQYLNDAAEGLHFQASPLRADSFTGLPPACVLVAEFDPLLDEGLAYADRLEAAGVRVERIHCDGQIHGFVRRLDAFDRAGEVLRQLGELLRRELPAPTR